MLLLLVIVGKYFDNVAACTIEIFFLHGGLLLEERPDEGHVVG